MELSSRTIGDKTFGGSLRGYDRAEVRDYLNAVARYVSSLEEQLAISSAKAERTQEELDRLNDVLDKRLEEAQAARATIIEEAKREAASLRAGSGDDPATARRSAAIIAEAEAKATLRLEHVDRVTEEARDEAAAIVASAERDAERKLAEADRILDKAKHDAREFRRELTRRRTIGSSDIVIDLTAEADQPAET